jgi:methyltransferase (TIGR00027 family)
MLGCTVRDEVPSRTAAWVAAMRGLGAFLPVDQRLVDDRWGLRFAGKFAALRDNARIEARARETAHVWLRGRLRRTVLILQLRTRLIDDDVEAFTRAGGRQVVLLGAGFDCRAWRLGRALAGATVFEVDHPATQEKKRAAVGGDAAAAKVVFVPWDFEREPLSDLPARLAAEGHDARAPTMTISEGVLMYLTSEAVDATFSCVKSYTAAGSPVAFTYFDRALVIDRSRDALGERAAVRLIGEPFRFGFDPSAVPAWLEARGFRLERDESCGTAARKLLPADVAERLAGTPRVEGRRFALARRS